MLVHSDMHMGLTGTGERYSRAYAGAAGAGGLRRDRRREAHGHLGRDRWWKTRYGRGARARARAEASRKQRHYCCHGEQRRRRVRDDLPHAIIIIAHNNFQYRRPLLTRLYSVPDKLSQVDTMKASGIARSSFLALVNAPFSPINNSSAIMSHSMHAPNILDALRRHINPWSYHSHRLSFTREANRHHLCRSSLSRSGRRLPSTGV